MAGPGIIKKGWRDTRTIAYLTLDTLFWSKKTLFLVFLSVLILGLALVGRIVMSYGLVRGAFESPQVFGALMALAVNRFMVIFVTLFYGTALISEEVDNKTLTFLFTRPIPKTTIMMGKFLAQVWIGAILILPTVILCYLILYLGLDMQLFLQDLGVLGKDIGIVFLAILAYGSFFSVLGAWLKHSFLIGLFYAFGWEGIVSLLPGFTRKLTIAHYLQSLNPHNDSLGAIAMMIGERTGGVESVATLLLLSTLLLATAALIVREREFVLEQ